jgi:hypothetical protein
MGGMAILLLCSTYTCGGWTGARNLMFITVPGSMAVGYMLSEWIRSKDRRGAARARILVGMIALVTIGLSMRSAVSWLDVHQYYSNERLEIVRDFAAGYDHEPDKLLVAPYFFVNYAVEHYPVRWSPVPFNVETLRLLEARYPVGTIVLEEGDDTRIFPPGVLAREGFVPRGGFSSQDRRFLVYTAR